MNFIYKSPVKVVQTQPFHSPSILITIPSSIPAGISISIFFVCFILFAQLHFSQIFSIVCHSHQHLSQAQVCSITQNKLCLL